MPVPVDARLVGSGRGRRLDHSAKALAFIGAGMITMAFAPPAQELVLAGAGWPRAWWDETKRVEGLVRLRSEGPGGGARYNQ